jgi:hypothetical protein
MVYYGHGFSWTELYNMPVWLRKFYYKKTEEAKIEEKKRAEQSKPVNPKKSIPRPKIAPKPK